MLILKCNIFQCTGNSQLILLKTPELPLRQLTKLRKQEGFYFWLVLSNQIAMQASTGDSSFIPSCSWTRAPGRKSGAVQAELVAKLVIKCDVQTQEALESTGCMYWASRQVKNLTASPSKQGYQWVYRLVPAITTLNHVFQIRNLLAWWLISNRPISAEHLKGLSKNCSFWREVANNFKLSSMLLLSHDQWS